MKKKCLGCGKIFEDKISICQVCFKAIEATRNQFASFSQNFQKNPYLFVRKFILWVAPLNLFMFFLRFLFTATPLIIKGSKYDSIFLIVSVISVPIIFLFLIGVYLGNFLQHLMAVKLIKQWSDKEWYSVPTRSWRYTKYWAPVILPFFVFGLVILLFWFILKSVILSSLVESMLLNFFYLGVGLGFNALSPGFFLGFSVANYFSTDWIPKLSK